MSVSKIWIYIIFCIHLCVVTGCTSDMKTLETGETYIGQTEERESKVYSDTEEHEKTKYPETVSETLIYVYVCGYVKEPGVRVLPEGSRWYQAVDAAGGMLPEADPGQVNLAAKLTDGQKVYIPSVMEHMTDLQSEADTVENTVRIDINHASKEELMTLPGIGASKADAIVSFRESEGGFESIEELMNIPGIKEGVYSRIKDLICVG